MIHNMIFFLPPRFYKGVYPLWLRQIPYTMMKFACFERTVEMLYKYVVPKPRSSCSKPEQLVVTFIAGYIGEWEPTEDEQEFFWVKCSFLLIMKFLVGGNWLLRKISCERIILIKWNNCQALHSWTPNDCDDNNNNNSNTI